MSKVYVHPLPVRIWHWANVILFIGLVVTGVQVRYLDLVDLMPFQTAVMLHNWVGFALIANFFVWLLFYLFSERNQAYHPELNIVKLANASFEQAKYYGWGMFRGEHNPHRIDPYHKFNPLQRTLYQILMLFLLPMQFATGLLMWDIKRFSAVIEMVGGLRVVSTVHVLIFIFFVFYLFFHPYLATLGHTPTAHIRAMVTGFEDVEDEPAAPAAS
ncbi:cytochrome b/b6 domain-containing protein [Ramlibacter alkalitolerans]|uniref:Cytochrome b/b6 domain-containing protein n=1 Tax=Ramlibacter alkalitolerans TaxID=2039631 RepID=A0ABS1JTN2_9BURK|nr:cytochrome b/b6 domain-containing protein [Ramlibacter alkalitolerans]MBL0427614.1 cytochrome b/b6 domain-containing protein [Ramlibacter alkalitolerans]